MSLLTDTMTIQRKMETIITTKVNFTALAIITLNLRMAVLLTEVGTLVAAIEETFQTRVPIGDFLALVLIHITMDPPNAARRGISTTCNGLHQFLQLGGIAGHCVTAVDWVFVSHDCVPGQDYVVPHGLLIPMQSIASC